MVGADGQAGNNEQDGDISDEAQSQAQGDEPYSSDVKLGKAWGESITKRRADELEARLDAWEQEADHGERKGPFEYAELYGAEVFWLAARILAGTDNRQAVTQQMERLRQARDDGRVRLQLTLSTLHLERVILSGADLSGAFLSGANLSDSLLNITNLSGALLDGVNFSGAFLGRATLPEAFLVGADLSGASLSDTNLTGANLTGVTLTAARLSRATLSGALLGLADLAKANLSDADLSKADLGRADLSGADLSGVRMSVETNLSEATLSPTTRLADVVWNAVPLARVAWETLPIVGDEIRARSRRDDKGKKKPAATRIAEYEAAVRAYRLLTVALRSQGLNEHADRYAYRAQLMQRQVLRRRGIRKWPAYIGSLLLDLLAGYGYRPGRAIWLYLAIIVWFANFYVWSSNELITLGLPPSHVEPLAWYEALILSVSSFHGRGFQPFQHLNDPVAALAGIQAVFGVVIEVSFIATFTQRFFGK